MCPQAAHLLAVCVIACIVHVTPVFSQCTTKHCVDDDSDVSLLTATVSRLQDTMELQHQHYLDSLEQQQSQHQESLELLQQHFNDSLEEQQEHVTELENMMTEKISTLELGMIYMGIFFDSRCFHTVSTDRSI